MIATSQCDVLDVKKSTNHGLRDLLTVTLTNSTNPNPNPNPNPIPNPNPELALARALLPKNNIKHHRAASPASALPSSSSHATSAAEPRRGAALESRSDKAAVLPVRARFQRLLAVAPRLCPVAESKGQPAAAGVAAHAAGP